MTTGLNSGSGPERGRMFLLDFLGRLIRFRISFWWNQQLTDICSLLLAAATLLAANHSCHYAGTPMLLTPIRSASIVARMIAASVVALRSEGLLSPRIQPEPYNKEPGEYGVVPGPERLELSSTPPGPDVSEEHPGFLRHPGLVIFAPSGGKRQKMQIRRGGRILTWKE